MSAYETIKKHRRFGAERNAARRNVRVSRCVQLGDSTAGVLESCSSCSSGGGV